MVVKGDQQRIRALIKDTLTLLCKNGLNFESQFCMEALIVFTLDNEDVFHVSINETVKNALAAADASSMAGARDEAEEHDDETPSRHKPSQQSSGASRKRSYQDIKFEVEEQREGSSSSDGQTLDTGGDGFGQDTSHRRDPESSTSLSTKPPPPKRQELDHSDQLPDDDDIVIIKEEDDNDEEYEGDDTNSSYAYDPGSASGYPYGDPDLAQTTSLFPESTQGSPGIWPNISQQSGSATVTSEGMEGNSFSSDQLLGRVLETAIEKTHKPPRCYQCPKCHKGFTTNSSLKSHLELHMGIYKYHCSQCQKGFSSSSSLRGHMAKHTGVKEFACHICHRSYAHKKHLTEHMKFTHYSSLPTQPGVLPQTSHQSGPIMDETS